MGRVRVDGRGLALDGLDNVDEFRTDYAGGYVSMSIWTGDMQTGPAS